MLLCHFPKQVFCAWFRRGSYMDINKRYSFVDVKTNGELSTDCSIVIDDFQEADLGQWDCESMSGSRNNDTKGSSITLNLGKNRLVIFWYAT